MSKTAKPRVTGKSPAMAAENDPDVLAPRFSEREKLAINLLQGAVAAGTRRVTDLIERADDDVPVALEAASAIIASIVKARK